jgi:hypothetical protein
VENYLFLKFKTLSLGLVFILVCLIPSILLAKREHPEKWYQEQWCEDHRGQVELVLPDGTRCDCLTDTHAIEFDFGNNWAEAVGQSAYYSLQTKKKPGIVLILETMKDRKYWIRLNTTIEHFHLPIDTWNIGNASYSNLLILEIPHFSFASNLTYLSVRPASINLLNQLN